MEPIANSLCHTSTGNSRTDGEELTNVSTCSSSSIAETRTTTSERDSEDCYADVGFMFEGLQTSTLKRFTWGGGINNAKPQVRVALHIVDETAGALQSGHYLWPASSSLAEYIMDNFNGMSSLSSFREPHNVLELGAGSALVSLVALQVFSESLQCISVTDHDPGTLERARDNYETTLEDLLESTQTEEEQFDCINGLASIPVMFEALEWGDRARAQEIADNSSPLTQGRSDPSQHHATNPNQHTERNIFDLLLGSDLIYCSSVVNQLFQSVSYLMTPGGSFILAQSMVYDNGTELTIDETCQSLNLERTILLDTLSREKGRAGGVRIQLFRFRANLDLKQESQHSVVERK